MDKLSISLKEELEKLPSDKIVCEFLDINKNLKSLVKKVNEFISKKKFSEAFSYFSAFDEISERIDNLEKRMPSDFNFTDKKVKEELRSYSNSITDLIKESQKMIAVEEVINKNASEFIMKEVKKRIDRETSYNNKGKIHASKVFGYSHSLGIKSKI